MCVVSRARERERSRAFVCENFGPNKTSKVSRVTLYDLSTSLLRMYACMYQNIAEAQRPGLCT